MPKRKIIDYATVRNDVPCQYCKFRKELYKEYGKYGKKEANEQIAREFFGSK